MKTKWSNWSGEKAELHKMTSGKVWAVMTKDGLGTRQVEFVSAAEAKEFFTTENGWH
jgi:hypothetical protein